MQYSTNYNMKKPETTDNIKIADINYNTDLLDEKIDDIETDVNLANERLNYDFTYDGTNIIDSEGTTITYTYLIAVNNLASKTCRIYYTVSGVMRVYKFVAAKSSDYVLFSSQDETTIYFLKVAKSGTATVITTSQIPNADNTSY